MEQDAGRNRQEKGDGGTGGGTEVGEEGMRMKDFRIRVLRLSQQSKAN